MDIREYITDLGFVPKDGAGGVYHKVYASLDGYSITVDFNAGRIDYGDNISADSRTTQNFSQMENFVVLECVDRLLNKGYKPQNIVLEKTWPSGHGTSGRLDICVNRDDGTPYMLVECKTFGGEFKKEFQNIHKNGGQLFSYFQLSGCKADILVLYASELQAGVFVYKNEIIKIEDEYRGGTVQDIYEKWNKLTKDNGIFDAWVKPYNFQNQALIKSQLKEITAKDSSFIFNRFLEILRHNVVSDKGNAFNKIFTLFLCKVYDETTTRLEQELKFQWVEGRDNHVDFQLRLMDLYSKGMKKFLDRTVSDFNDEDFENRCRDLNEDTKQFLRREVNKLRLEKNNEFAIKEVYDHPSFEENAKVVKEVVELIQGYRIRYNKRQQYLSDFFELLLTTGLKQEAGQYFTPIPVAQFIIKSIPIDDIVAEKLSSVDGEILPYMIDYAAGSGHFITEYMHEVQGLLNKCDTKPYIDETKTKILQWKQDQFAWATKYVYGVEKDYRLVKVSKVGCYLHGDGLAKVILSDGLADFLKNTEYKGKLHKEADDGKKDNQQFDILLSNPPYSVSSFRQTTRNYYTEEDFDLYNELTDSSSEIECLFVERAKQLLKDGGVAGIVLPSSILSNTGIYTGTREIILRYFDIVGIAELGGNTFMATNTNTVVMFMRRRNSYFADNTKKAVEKSFSTLSDFTINGIETPVAKYVAHVWEGLDFSDYVTLLQEKPNEKVSGHDMFLEYKKKFKENDFWPSVHKIESEKLLYFILAYPQRVVVVRSGEKDEEREFLGYEFSKRRGNEGIHAIQRGKNIDECTKMFDVDGYENPDKASTYIYKAFKGDYDFPISECMQSYVSRFRLIDMMTFDADNFEKTISLTVKAKPAGEWPQVKLGTIATVQAGNSAPQGNEFYENGKYPFFRTSDIAKKHICPNLTETRDLLNDNGIRGLRLFKKGSILFPKSGRSTYLDHRAMMGVDGYVSSHLAVITVKDSIVVNPKYLYETLIFLKARDIKQSSGYPSLKEEELNSIRISLPPKEIQDKITDETDLIEEDVLKAEELIDRVQLEADRFLASVDGKVTALGEVAPYGVKSLKFNEISPETYVTTDNMLQDKLGIRPFNGVANINSVTEYRKGDILVSNIRPYLKKIWLADRDGGCSKDVLVFKSSDSGKCLPEYLYYMLSRDVFFEYMMEDKAGIKMPRGNKSKIIRYGIPVPPVDEQRRIAEQVREMVGRIATARADIDAAASRKQEVLDKYL